MYSKALISLLALPLLANGQSLASVLAGAQDLSTLNTIIGQFPGLAASLNGTILAPTNAALEAFITSAGGLSALSPALIQNVLSYHVIPGATLRSTDLSGQGGAVGETLLHNSTWANIGEGEGNVVFVSAYGTTGVGAQGPLKIYSGVGTEAGVVQADVAYDGGVVHVIDRVLNLPQTPSNTAVAADLSILVAAVTQAELVSTIDTTPKLTIFAPTDDAFKAAGIDLTKLSREQLTQTLQYHVIAGTVGYSTVVEDGGEYETLLGSDVKVTKKDGKVWINDAEVVVGNVITSNGVVHVINKVLSPAAASSSGSSKTSSSATATSPASGTTAGSTSSASHVAASYKTAAAALFLAVCAFAL